MLEHGSGACAPNRPGLGECVAPPALVRIREARPRSRDPRFYEYWTSDNAPHVPVEEICADWEGRSDVIEDVPVGLNGTKDGDE